MFNPRRMACLLCGLTAGLMITGCAGPAPTARTFSHLHLEDVSRAAAFDAIVDALRERYPIATTDRAGGTVRCVPVESPDDASPRRPGEVLGTGRKVRRVATAQVTGSDAACDVWCKVVVQQRDDAAALIYSTELGRSDAPTMTPADRDGATTAEQNEVWRTMHRDKREERDFLDAVEKSVGGSVSSRPGNDRRARS